MVLILLKVGLPLQLKVAKPAPRGFPINGANPVTRAIGKALQQRGKHILLTDSNWESISAARMGNLPTCFDNPVSQHADSYLDLLGIGQLLALSPASEQNNLACTRFPPRLRQANLYSLANPREQRLSEKRRTSHEHRGQPSAIRRRAMGNCRDCWPGVPRCAARH